MFHPRAAEYACGYSALVPAPILSGVPDSAFGRPGAIALYESIGYAVRTTLNAALVRREG